MDVADLPAALDHHRRVVALRPTDPAAHSDLLFWSLHDPATTPAAARDAALDWGHRHADPLVSDARPHDNDANPDRPLRVGYVSADFRDHTRARFMEGVLANHDPAAVEVFCYSDVARPDATTARFKTLAHAWRDTGRLTHAALADLVRADRIDVLVELTGHMGGNRLMAFARRPAPVQVAYPGYPATTGMRAIDYCLSDAGRDPPGAERFYAEQLVRLDVASQCYRPTDEDLPVAPAPAVAAGHVTFASLNKPIKANPTVIEAWAGILRAMPGSRLMLLCPDAARPYFTENFARFGVPADRLELVPPRPRREYLRLHARIDVNLDPWPYNGHTTLLDGLWMGVPAVALEGGSHVSREGAAALRLVGLHDLVASGVDDYLAKATTLAAEPARLAALRAGLRDRIRASPLADGGGLVRRIETAYREMWRAWCARRG
jgi:predicted O-linked N-acetylglucosamine transferase (SPINDLY family)